MPAAERESSKLTIVDEQPDALSFIANT